MLSENIPQLINKTLGNRSFNALYSYSDLILNLSYIAFCGGDCVEDIYHLKSTFRHLRGMKTASPDTLLNMQKELSTKAEEIKSESGISNKININTKLNKLLIKIASHLGVLSSKRKDYCLDFDHQFIPTEKYDATRSYKKERGYFPAVASIENTPVYIENRNGNCQVKFNQLDTLKRVFSLLEDEHIKPSSCRMDCGSYIKEVCDYLQDNDVTFYIRAERSEQLLFEASVNENWKPCTIGIDDSYEVCSTEHKFGEHIHRIVAYRWPNKTGQKSLSTNDANDYLFIITNDRKNDEEHIIKVYNYRGNSERLFDIQNNDFNWKQMPFSFLEQNTVYLILMAICHVFYKWLINVYSKSCSFLEPNYRLKKFIFYLVNIAVKVVYTGRRQVVKLFTMLNIPTAINSS